ncbi:mannose-1-phosphate guanylyltransferase/mannose-6-phosphate isomerase [Serratia marcescens]|nr:MULTISPECIES: mannose-1-phosphate guanylyltransferase/mannose-6-phosphate isomerase [Serratia]MBN5273108.1 mannose-1-phosphate guanylyltransferase/mannose-6-phosphate isomerase [Serratia marcescens]MBN5276108.1 mannose-1-phosphate guanylyltransferase/mannose-6-phosphate isomerase [Serratia marcescens]MBN5306530.1 mannose-1-phosphate guanylyltransferase/mannose-6-phosphate isomerase [Serratia marcescens]MBN5364936.1 mannose-1-phosphate guanylyltransferase/mannose-6-phosphate isomerase [Serrat
MIMSNIYPVIMAGGTGSRLWPLSRELFPKQFLALCSEFSMLQTTVNRLDGLEISNPLVICNEEHRFIVAEQLRQITRLSHNIILEPVGRNTAPAIALAALQATANGEDPLLLVLAADHVIQDEKTFRNAVLQAVPFAQDGKLATFGIVPTGPETGYGYIHKGESIDGSATCRVSRFVEKPNLVTAEEYLRSGEYLWNSGMFLFKASRYLEELNKYRPDILSACRKSLQHTSPDLDFVRVDREAFLTCPDESVDYAVMEQTADAVVVPLDAGWSDVGSWSALWEISEKDSSGNSTFGDVLQHGSTNNYIRAEHKLVATVGVDNLVVVETKDAVLIANKDKVQDVKEIVNHLKRSKRPESKQHREVYRPWGQHDAIAQGDRFQVRKITVKPGEKLSLQMHHHRSEHWVVVSGTAKVTKGGVVQFVSENESVYIPLGVEHSLENPGKIALNLIEIQSGSYLHEDDIVRFDDSGKYD